MLFRSHQDGLIIEIVGKHRNRNPGSLPRNGNVFAATETTLLHNTKLLLLDHIFDSTARTFLIKHLQDAGAMYLCPDHLGARHSIDCVDDVCNGVPALIKNFLGECPQGHREIGVA